MHFINVVSSTIARESKNVIEQAVTLAVVDFLKEPANLEKALTDVLKYYDSRTDEKNLKSIQTKIANLEKEMVLMVVKEALVYPIIKEIYAISGFKTNAKGTVFALPISKLLD